MNCDTCQKPFTPATEKSTTCISCLLRPSRVYSPPEGEPVFMPVVKIPYTPHPVVPLLPPKPEDPITVPEQLDLGDDPDMENLKGNVKQCPGCKMGFIPVANQKHCPACIRMRKENEKAKGHFKYRKSAAEPLDDPAPPPPPPVDKVPESPWCDRDMVLAAYELAKLFRHTDFSCEFNGVKITIERVKKTT